MIGALAQQEGTDKYYHQFQLIALAARLRQAAHRLRRHENTRPLASDLRLACVSSADRLCASTRIGLRGKIYFSVRPGSMPDKLLALADEVIE